MIEREDWYDANFIRDVQGGHYCVECQEVVGTDMDAITHLLRVHEWEEVNFHEGSDW